MVTMSLAEIIREVGSNFAKLQELCISSSTKKGKYSSNTVSEAGVCSNCFQSRTWMLYLVWSELLGMWSQAKAEDKEMTEFERSQTTSLWYWGGWTPV